MRRTQSRKHKFAALLVALATFLLGAEGASPALAQGAAESLETARGIAMGTGARASAVSTSALAYNPANMPLGSMYHIDGFASYEPSWGRWIAGASVVDSMTSQLAMGASFRGIISNGEEGYSGFDARLGAGYPISDAFALGLAGRFMSIEQEGTGLGGGGKDGRVLARHFTMDASLRVTLTEGLNLAALAYNFIDAESVLVPILLGGGASYTANGFSIGMDVLTDLTTYEKAKPIFGGGAEYLAGDAVPIRAGYKYDAGTEVHSISAGLGYVSAVMGMDIGLNQQVKGGKETEVMVSLRYFVQ